MQHPRRAALGLAVTLFAVLLLTASASAAPVARAAKTCSVRGQETRLGATYVLKVTARRVSCRSARSLVRAYHSCRRDNGGADGRCGRVRGFKCSESRRGIATQYDATATCRKGGKRVSQRYTQNT